MHKNIIVFAGTTEGRKIAEYLAGHGIQTHVCVATEYGEKLMMGNAEMTISHERLTEEEMVTLIQKKNPSFVIDATHPYAVKVTKNIKNACENVSVKYIRVVRDRGTVTEDKKAADTVYVESAAQAVEFLKGTQGNVLLTTGSKELSLFTDLEGYTNRLYARVLSTPEVVESCAELGFAGAHLICMQGPFSKELNRAMLKQVEAEYMVTKDSGAAGGFLEKCQAAEECGVRLVVIGRPVEESGMSLKECKLFCREQLSGINGINKRKGGEKAKSGQHVTLVGIGMGNERTLTKEALGACRRAQLIIGASRMIKSVAKPDQAVYHAYKPDEIAAYIKSHPEYKKIAVVLSGDAGFYSGAKRLLPLLKMPHSIVCGISSLAYFCGQIGKSWDDVTTITMHGRNSNLIGAVQSSPKVFALIGSEHGVAEQCEKLTHYGFGECRVWIGENLGYDSENIRQGKAEEFVNVITDKLCVFYIENDLSRDRIVTHGIADETFLRDKVPMTKEEIRAISISKMHLKKDSIVYDIGAGTGSVSVEMAMRISEGRVYAIEKNPRAIELLKQNKQKFAVDYLEIMEGSAPESLDELPVPTHVFIGGTSGKLKEIMLRVLHKNPNVRIVINAITLETVAEALSCMKMLPVEHVEIIQVSIAKSKNLGKYHMMMGQNPVYIISCGGAK